MTDTLVLKNKLVMPQAGTYLEIDQDEMEYVDGGWYLDRSTCRKISDFSGFGSRLGDLGFSVGLSMISSVIASYSKIKAFVSSIYYLTGSKIMAGIATLSRIAAAIVGVVIVIASSYAIDFLARCAQAAAAGKGVELSLGFLQFNASFR